MKVKSKNLIKTGMTLVELMVYLAIFGFIFISVVGFSMNIGRAHTMASERKVLQKDIIFITQHIRESFISSTSIDSNNSIFNSNNGKLILVTSTGNLEYSIASSRLNFLKSSQNNVLTGNSVRISKFFLQEIRSRENNLIGIRASITLYDVNNPIVMSDFESTYFIK